MRLNRIALAATLVAGLTSTAMATDLFMADDNAYVAPEEDGFDWDGFYLGATAGVYYEGDPVPTLGKTVGFNVTSGDFLFGAEVSAFGIFSDWVGVFYNAYDISANARAGYLVTDDALVYVLAGGGYYRIDGPVVILGPTTYGLVGAGAEFALTDNLSARAEYRGYIYPSGGLEGHEARFGLLWHPGN